jgi:hypothetical protein
MAWSPDFSAGLPGGMFLHLPGYHRVVQYYIPALPRIAGVLKVIH